LALGYGGEEASEGGAEIAGGDEGAGKVIGDVFAGGFGSEGLRVLAGVEGAEIGMGGAGSAALAAVGKGERTQRGTSVGAIGGHGISRRKIFEFWDFLGKSRLRRGVVLNGNSISKFYV